MHSLLSHLPFNEYSARHIFRAITLGHWAKLSPQGQQPKVLLNLVKELFPGEEAQRWADLLCSRYTFVCTDRSLHARARAARRSPAWWNCSTRRQQSYAEHEIQLQAQTPFQIGKALKLLRRNCLKRSKIKVTLIPEHARPPQLWLSPSLSLSP